MRGRRRRRLGVGLRGGLRRALSVARPSRSTGSPAARWTWDEFRALPAEDLTVDIHCVTKWSKLGTHWRGVPVDVLLDGVETAMLRHHVALESQVDLHLVYSARTAAELLYRDELETVGGGPHRRVTITLTREAPGRWPGRSGRVDAGLLEEVARTLSRSPRCYVCGPTQFVEDVARALVGLGHDPPDVRTERFGPTGG